MATRAFHERWMEELRCIRVWQLSLAPPFWELGGGGLMENTPNYTLAGYIIHNTISIGTRHFHAAHRALQSVSRQCNYGMEGESTLMFLY